MDETQRRPSRVLVYSSGNADGAFLAAGLLHARYRASGTILIQGTAAATPAPEVLRALGEVGIDLHAWVPLLASGAAPEAVQLGVTICTPT